MSFGSLGQFALGEASLGTTTVEIDQWLMPWSEPVRSPPRLNPALNPSFSMGPLPIVDISWFEALSEPQRDLPSLKPAGQPSQFDVPVLVFTPEGWFMPLSEPRVPSRDIRTASQLPMVRAIPPFSPAYSRGYVIT